MTKQFTKGFTLIELLVVVAIIGLLAAIVMGALQGAREKGVDSKKLQMVSEWKKALELYYDDNERYPSTGTIVGSYQYACLGSGYSSGSNGACVLTGQSVSEPNTSLSQYYPSLPIPEADIDAGGDNLAGIGYKCLSSNTDCSGYVIRWFQKSSQCGEGVEDLTVGDYTACTITRQP